MQLSHTRPVAAAIFDDPNLVSTAGLVPVMALARRCDLAELADEHLSVPTDKGANAGRKIGSLVAGMVAGADSIADMAILRHGAMKTLFDRPYASSTLGSFLREFTFGHVRQLDAVASRFLQHLGEAAPLVAGIDTERVLVDIDDSIIEVHGHSKQGSGYGYSGVRGLNSLISTLTTSTTAPVIVGQRLRKGSCGSSRGAARMIADTLTTVGRIRAAVAIPATTSSNRVEPQPMPKPLVCADSAFFGYPTIGAAVRGGADVSITTGLNSVIRSAIGAIPDDAWIPIEYTHAVFDEEAQRWISVGRSRRNSIHRVRLAEESPPHSRPVDRPTHPPAFDRRRIRDNVNCSTCGGSTRSSATTDPAALGTVAADKIHRRHGNHRASTCGPEELSPRPFTVEPVHRQRCVARLRGDGVQTSPAPLRH